MQSALGFSCFFFGSFLFVLSNLRIMSRKTRANRKTTSSSTPSFESDRFRTEKNQETYEKLNIFRSVWAKRKVVLDELNPEIRRNFERRGWLPLMDTNHPPPTILIKQFYLNLTVHSNDSNTQFVKSWIRGEEYVITPSVVASALGLHKVQHPIYPYDEPPPLDDIMSYLIGSSIQWGSDPRITYHELTEIHYLFFRISCHSIWPISHLHTIPIERCAYLYALVTDAPMSFPHLFIRSLVEVHRSSATGYGLFFPIFIHRILLHLGLDEFPTFEPVPIIAPIGATFLRQRAAQMRASSKRPKVESSLGVAPPPPSSLVDPTTEAYVDLTVATTSPPSTSNDSSIRRMLDTIKTVQAAHDQLLVDVLTELQALRELDGHLCHLLLMMSHDCPLAICHKKGEYIWMEILLIKGDFFILELWSFRLYLGASPCTYDFGS